MAIGRTLPDVEVTTTWGAPALKVRGKMFACVAINKSAEPNSMVVRMDMTQRDLLIEEDPATYYLTDHYVDYPCVLVRLRVFRRTRCAISSTARTDSSAPAPSPVGARLARLPGRCPRRSASSPRPGSCVYAAIVRRILPPDLEGDLNRGRQLLAELQAAMNRFGATEQDQAALASSIRQLDELFLSSSWVSSMPERARSSTRWPARRSCARA